MNKIEEELWNYIDGSCADQERLRLRQLIESDHVYRLKYEALLRFNEELSTVEPEQPSLGFSYRVIEQIRQETRAKTLHARINRKLVYGIGSFFILGILMLLSVAVLQVNFSAPAASGSAAIPQYMRTILTGRVSEGILFLDAILGLILLDAGLRQSGGRRVDVRN